MPHRHLPALAILVATTLAIAGCAGKKAPPPPYDPAAAAEAQAASFISANKDAKLMADVKKLAITSCNVMFAQTSGATASTGGGIGTSNDNRVEAKVSVYYTLVGLTENDMQKMTDAICASAETKLKNAGYTFVPKSELDKNEAIIELRKSGRKSPFEYKNASRGSQSRYLVFAPSGQTVFDERYIGSVAGLGQAFKAAKGTSAWQHEARAMNTLKADAVNLNILVDFAKLTSSGQGAAAGGIASRNSAEVETEVGLSVNGDLRIKPVKDMKCWTRFGKFECGLPAKYPQFVTARPITTGQPFYKSVKEVTTTGDKVGSALVTGLAMLAGGSKLDITRYNVEVEPKTFEKVSRVNIDGFIDMAAVSANKAKTGK